MGEELHDEHRNGIILGLKLFIRVFIVDFWTKNEEHKSWRESKRSIAAQMII